MATSEAALRALAQPRDGVVSWHEAIDAGFTWRSIATRVKRGSWQRIGRCIVIRDLHHPGDPATAWILHLHCGPGSTVSGAISMRLQGWEAAGSDHIALNPTDRRGADGLDLRVVRRHSPRRTSRPGLPPLAPRMDALVDTLIWRPPTAGRTLLDLALQRRWITAGDLDAALIERSGPGRRGQRRLRELCARAASGSRSEAEQRMGHLLRRTPGTWIANYAIRDESGRVLAEIDFADPQLMIAIEVDGRAFHSDRQAFERDRERQNMLTLRGWIVLRFTWERLVNDPEGVLAEVAAAQAHRRLRAHTA